MAERIFECECGRLKRCSSSEGCDRCARLDGRFKIEREIIAALRTHSGGLTIAELVAITGCWHRAIERTALKMRRAGRLVAIEGLQPRIEPITIFLAEDAG